MRQQITLWNNRCNIWHILVPYLETYRHLLPSFATMDNMHNFLQLLCENSNDKYIFSLFLLTFFLLNFYTLNVNMLI